MLAGEPEPEGRKPATYSGIKELPNIFKTAIPFGFCSVVGSTRHLVMTVTKNISTFNRQPLPVL